MKTLGPLIWLLFIIGTFALCVVLMLRNASDPVPYDPTPVRPALPQPAPYVPPPPPDPPCPPHKPCPREDIVGASVDGPAHDGVEVTVELPPALQVHNITSRGEGCCVFRSLDHAAHSQDVPSLYGFPEWLQAHNQSGGGYPGNVKERITAICKDRGVPEPQYIQIENSKDMSLLVQASKGRRMICVTYSRSPTGRYNNGRIAHMVNAAHVDSTRVAILDNNFVADTAHGDHIYEWMTHQEFLTVCNPGGYWAIILLTPGLPPTPHPLHRKDDPVLQPLVLATALLLPSQPQNLYSWEPFSDGDDTQVKLMYNNHQVGVLVLATGLYYRCDPQRRSIDVQPSEPPCTLPLNHGSRNMGIVTNKMPTSERYEINGQSVHRDQVARALGAGIPDDSNKQSVVAVGAKSDTDRLSALWLSDQAFAPYRDSTLFQAHDNTYWWIVQHGLTPGIWVFSQEGTALHHQADLNPNTLAVALRTIQVKPDPNFRPDQVPDLSVPVPSPSLSPSQWLEHPQHLVGLTLALLIIAGLAVYIHSKNARSS